MYRKALGLLVTILLTAGASVWASDNQVLAELRFMAHNGAEKKAGVWVDGQYVGFVKELNGDKKLMPLLRGRRCSSTSSLPGTLMNLTESGKRCSSRRESTECGLRCRAIYR